MVKLFSYCRPYTELWSRKLYHIISKHFIYILYISWKVFQQQHYILILVQNILHQVWREHRAWWPFLFGRSSALTETLELSTTGHTGTTVLCAWCVYLAAMYTVCLQKNFYQRLKKKTALINIGNPIIESLPNTSYNPPEILFQKPLGPSPWYKLYHSLEIPIFQASDLNLCPSCGRQSYLGAFPSQYLHPKINPAYNKHRRL